MMASFPKLSKIKWEWSIIVDFVNMPALGVITSYPTIISFEFYDWELGHDAEVATSLITACPNLTYLKCDGPTLCQVVKEVITSCSKVTTLLLTLDINRDLPQGEVMLLLQAIAAHGLQLKDLTIQLSDLVIDINNASIRAAMINIIKRLQNFDIDVGFVTGNADGEPDTSTSICSLFSSPGVDLQTLSISTSNENADQIAMMLRGCRHVDALSLKGEANISEVMMKISGICQLLLCLHLNYNTGQVNRQVMLALLKSCHRLKSLSLCLELQAYEALALQGGNLINLNLQTSQPASTAAIGAFHPSSPIYDIGFKQQMKYPMASLSFRAPALELKSFAKFMSCFGMIGKLSIELYPFQLPADFRIDMYDDIPIYHARSVSVVSAIGKKNEVDNVFLAMMNSCRSLRHLHVASTLQMDFISGKIFVDAAC
jgi:hypothetical protein